MKKSLVFLVVAAIVIVGVIVVFLKNTKSAGIGDCSKFSNKDGYAGCMSIVNGKEKKCKFKVDNKVNEATQQMEFTYTCLEK